MTLILKYLVNNLLINPAFWLVLLLVLMAYICWQKEVWGKPLALVASLLIMAFFIPLSEPFMIAMERQYRPLDLEQEGIPNMVLVLGSGGIPDPILPASQRLTANSMARVLEAFRIWQAHPDFLLVLSSAGKEGFVSQAEIYAEALKEWGVPEENLALIPCSLNTQEEARDFKLTYPEANKLILVTSALHMPRSMRIFRGQGLMPFPAPTDFHYKEHPAGNPLNFIPSLQSIMNWQRLSHEWLGTLWVMVNGDKLE